MKKNSNQFGIVLIDTMKFKKKLFILIFTLFVVFATENAFCEQFLLNNIDYQITGNTRISALETETGLEKGKTFDSVEEIEFCVTGLTTKLINTRLFDEVNISYEIHDNSVDFVIALTDSNSLMIVPYPSFNTTSGVKLKFKVRDYNFFGFMKMIDLDFYYQGEKEDEFSALDHHFGTNLEFTVPFKIGKLSFEDTNTFGMEFSILSDKSDPSYKVSFEPVLSTSIPLNNSLSLYLSFAQSVVFDSSLADCNDSVYFSEAVSVGLPIVLYNSAASQNKLVWSPILSAKTNWDFDGISSEDLTLPSVTASSRFDYGTINWIGNFRKGYKLHLSNDFDYDIFENNITPSVSLTFQGHAFKSFVGFNNKVFAYYNFERKTKNFGSFVRGVNSNAIQSFGGVAANFDLTLKTFNTDNWYLPGILRYLHKLDFEMHTNLFCDVFLGQNAKTDSRFNFKDGYYTVGLEFIGYLKNWKSIQARLSAGFDVMRCSQKYLGYFTDQSWRKASSGYEISFGIGLFY